MLEFLEVFKYKYLLSELVKRDIKIKYRRSVLGMFWSVLNPLFFIAITYVVFSTIFKSSIKNFPLYAMTGQLIFSFYVESTSMAMSSIIGNGSLIKKVYIPKYVFPLSRVLSSFVNTGFSLIALLIVIVVTRADLYWTYVLIPIPFIFIFIFSMGVSFILASLAVFFRDMIHLYTVFTTMLMYLTAIYYPIEIIPQNLQKYFLLNPVYRFISYFREIILYGRVPSLIETVICLGISIATLIIGIYVFEKKENEFILFV
ncbi:ABC transporter permease [Cetobacterium somerae]|uniref:ABC transporter permease n=1 Tax=Cetobacterium somerae TaxID=188913 RepID=UPI00211E5144|nr:ABC transporter permease [Cetobacterium somerae]MCQ9628123.1 ABC transporter permease [Cetobacterium somerae]